MQHSRRTIIFFFLSLLGPFLVFTAYLFQKELARPPLPIYGSLAGFTLTDSNAREFGTADLKNKVWVIDFIFTTCSGVCPVMSRHMASLARSFALQRDVHFVSITVNPENDSPEVLTAYAKRLKADTARWHFLTGPRERITDIAVNQFKIGSVQEPVFHSSMFVLVDRKSQIRGYYDATEEGKIQQLFKDIAHLLKSRHE